MSLKFQLPSCRCTVANQSSVRWTADSLAAVPPYFLSSARLASFATTADLRHIDRRLLSGFGAGSGRGFLCDLGLLLLLWRLLRWRLFFGFGLLRLFRHRLLELLALFLDRLLDGQLFLDNRLLIRECCHDGVDGIVRADRECHKPQQQQHDHMYRRADDDRLPLLGEFTQRIVVSFEVFGIRIDTNGFRLVDRCTVDACRLKPLSDRLTMMSTLLTYRP